MSGIIWLASYPKSGNTWARIFLHNVLLDTDEPLDINTLSDLTLADGNKAAYEEAGGKPFASYSKGQVALLRPKVHELFARSQPDTVFVKTHSMFGVINGVPLITMEYTEGAIYILRNPLDVVVSLAPHFGMTFDKAIELMNNPNGGNSERYGNIIAQYFGSWSGHANSWTHFDQNRMHVMRYEDMLDKPEEAFGGLVRFLELEIPQEKLAKAIKFSSFDTVRKQEEKKGFNERSIKSDRFFRVGKAGQWKDMLSDDQVNRIVDCHHDAMKRYGYLPN